MTDRERLLRKSLTDRADHCRKTATHMRLEWPHDATTSDGLPKEVHCKELEAEAKSLDAMAADAAVMAKAKEALVTLQEMTGSRNDENPWLGVTSAVAMLMMP